MSGTYGNEFTLPATKPPRTTTVKSRMRPTGTQLTGKIRALGKVIDTLKMEKEQLVAVIDRLRKDIFIRDQVKSLHTQDQAILEDQLCRALDERLGSNRQVSTLKEQLKELSEQKTAEQIDRFELMQKNNILSIHVEDLSKEVATYQVAFKKTLDNFKQLATKIKTESDTVATAIANMRTQRGDLENQNIALIEAHAKSAAAEEFGIILKLAENMQREIYLNKSAFTDLKIEYQNKQENFESTIDDLGRKVDSLTVENTELKEELRRMQLGQFDDALPTDPRQMSSEDLKSLIQKFNILRANQVHKDAELHKLQHMLTEEMKMHAETALSTKKLEKQVRELEVSRLDIENQQRSVGTPHSSSETIKRLAQGEHMIKQMSLQLSQLMYENFKLREFVFQKTQEVVPEIELSLIVPQNLAEKDAQVLSSFANKVSHTLEEARSHQTRATGEETSTSRGGTRLKVSNNTQKPAPHDDGKELEKLRSELEKTKKQKEIWEKSSMKLAAESNEQKATERRLTQRMQSLEREKINGEAVVARLKAEIESLRVTASKPMEIRDGLILKM